MTVAVPDIIELLQLRLPETDGVHKFLTRSLVAQVDVLVKHQDPQTGLRHTLADDPTSYPEASATKAFWYYSITKALRKGLIPREEWYMDVPKKAMESVLMHFSEEVELKRTSISPWYSRARGEFHSQASRMARDSPSLRLQST